MIPPCILNIGMESSTSLHPSDRLTEYVFMTRLGRWLLQNAPDGAYLSIRRDVSEPTVIIGLDRVRTPDFIGSLFNLADTLAQDCIAVQFTRPLRAYFEVETTLELVGPRAYKWMPPDASKFLQPNPGVRL